ncbi:hypothetical protein I6A60_01995 [Frankia sp. AgB1.9]|uniref:hypothetical protein n=1 Tax=unclassified Frankia TaxID=2632575 RepID=UPI00193299D5|nr:MULTISPECIES: hypothetical protein [unclassified Frankia]MBL7490476.1 hypothetical protein [Frankia sp. AgW1.1]MBL7546658.1 hypothetical protein [Frankia sp. AgB1.9]MBL7624672.1 hypothetical protein [Frankia sp. AgB1.8]
MATRPETAALPFLRREPAAILAGVQAVITVIVAAAPLSAGWQALILAVTGAIIAAVTSWRTAPSHIALIWAIVQAGWPVFVLLGIHLPATAGAVLMALGALAAGAGTRAQVSPAEVGRPFPRG